MSDPLDAWMAEAKTDEAARSRSRRRWLHQQAAESSTLAGTLADLAGAGAGVVVVTTSGSEHHARLAAVGRDVLCLRAGSRRVLLPMGAVAMVRSGPDAPPVTGDRNTPSDMTMLSALEELRDDGSTVSVGVDGGRTVDGRLESVGVDVLSVRTGTGPASQVYVPLDAVLEVEVAGSG